MRITNSRISRRLDAVLREAFGNTLRVVDPSEHAAPRFVEAVGVAYAGREAGVAADATVPPAESDSSTDALVQRLVAMRANPPGS